MTRLTPWKSWYSSFRTIACLAVVALLILVTELSYASESTARGSLATSPLERELTSSGAGTTSNDSQARSVPAVSDLFYPQWVDFGPYPSGPGPTLRSPSQSAYDSTDHELILYGGAIRNSTGYLETLSDTWAFSQGSWKELSRNGGLGGRFLASMSDDPALGGIVLYGGVTLWNGSCPGIYNFCNDTWLFSKGSWTDLGIAGPYAGETADVCDRYGPAVFRGFIVAPSMTYDPELQGVLLWGGVTYWNSFKGTGCLYGGWNNETWLLHGGKWSLVASATPNVGSPYPACDCGWADAVPDNSQSAYPYNLNWDPQTGSVVLARGSSTWESTRGNRSIDQCGGQCAGPGKAYGILSYSDGYWTQDSNDVSFPGYDNFVFDATAGYGFVTGFGQNQTWAFQGKDAVRILSPDSGLTTSPSLLANLTAFSWLAPQKDLLDPNPDPLLWGDGPGAQTLVYDATDGYVVGMGIQNGTAALGECPGCQDPVGTLETVAYLGDGLTFLTNATALCNGGPCPTLLDGQSVDLTLGATLVHTFGYPGRAPIDEDGLLNVDPAHPFDPPGSTATASPVSFSYVPASGWAVANVSDIVVSCTNRTGRPDVCSPQMSLHYLPGGQTEYVWNWSIDSSKGMPVGDTWSVTVPLVLEGAITGRMPLDVCDTPDCLAAGDGPSSGGFTSITFSPYTVNSTSVVESFPPAFVNTVVLVQSGGTVPPPPLAPSPPAVASPIPSPVVAPAPIPLPVSTPIPISMQAAGAGFSVLALVAGLVMAGAVRVSLQRTRLRVTMAVRSQVRGPRFHSHS